MLTIAVLVLSAIASFLIGFVALGTLRSDIQLIIAAVGFIGCATLVGLAVVLSEIRSLRRVVYTTLDRIDPPG